jgi:indole-3-acetate monooxygenase
MDLMLTTPAEILESAAAEQIRGDALKAETQRNLTKTQQDIIHRYGWFNMYVPKEYGGLELPFPEILRIEESLSWADGSVAWVITLCSGAAWFVGFLDPGLADEVFANTEVCFAGSGAVSGTANKTPEGYEINGYWHHATGGLLAEVFTANCRVLNNGVPLFNETGGPVVTSFLFKKNEVIIHDTWNSMGMIATGSHAMEVKNKLIPFNRAFTISPSKVFLNYPVFQYPFLQLAETTLSVNLSGMAFRFLELCDGILLKRQHKRFDQQLNESAILLNSLRSEFFLKTDAAWETLITESKIPDTLLHDVSDVSHRLANGCRRIINELYPLCGLEAADTRNEINRIWRNFHTAGQHALFRSNS